MALAGSGAAGDGGPQKELRRIANQAFSRAAGAPLVAGNEVRLLLDAAQNYPAWLAAIQGAQRHVHLESYIFSADATGRRFADALLAKAEQGVHVRVVYDWLGCLRRAPQRFWERLRAGGVEVRAYNPLRLSRPLAWVSRDHRKMLAVDGRVGFISGLCISREWEGDAAKGLAPWRDTGIQVRGPAVADIEQAFAQVWAMTGPSIPAEEAGAADVPLPAGGVGLRVVASVPATSGMFRLDQLVAALALKRLWLADAYYAGMTAYVQALRAAARDGVDVRLLVPGASDIPMMKALSRAGYRTLLEAGVRVFEWKGSMLHAKSAVADGHWARVGSTNLNVSSWFGNCELDAVIEDEPLAREMEAVFLRDLENATEIVLDARRKVRSPRPSLRAPSPGGSVGRAAAGAVRIGNAIGAAFTDRRVLETVEARVMALAGLLLLALAVLFAFCPRLLAWPLSLVSAWVALTLLARGIKLCRQQGRTGPEAGAREPGGKENRPQGSP